jgi:hypothetical protein
VSIYLTLIILSSSIESSFRMKALSTDLIFIEKRELGESRKVPSENNGADGIDYYDEECFRLTCDLLGISHIDAIYCIDSRKWSSPTLCTYLIISRKKKTYTVDNFTKWWNKAQAYHRRNPLVETTSKEIRILNW